MTLTRNAVAAILLAAPILATAQVKTDWVKRYGGIINGSDDLAGMVCDAAGNVYLTGTSEGNGTGCDYATVKFDSVGNRLWVARYDGPASGDDEAEAITLDANGNVCVTGSSEDEGGYLDFATVAYSPGGVQLWVTRYQGLTECDDYPTAIAADGLGNVYVTGSSEYYVGERDDYDFLTVKYSSAGEEEWVRRYDEGLDLDEEPSAIGVDPSGNVYVTGPADSDSTGYDCLTIRYSASGQRLWVARYDGPEQGDDEPRALKVDQWGCACLTGLTDGPTGTDFLTIRYVPAGDMAWARTWDSPNHGEDEAIGLAVVGSDNFAVTGTSTASGGPDSLATVMYNPFGVELWTARYAHDDGRNTWAAAVGADDSGNVYVCGTCETPVGDEDYVTLKYDNAGVRQWRITCNGVGDGEDEAVALAVQGRNRVYTGGTSEGILGSTDFAVVRYRLGPRDVGVSAIASPPELAYPQHPVIPACSVVNYGRTVVSYSVRMIIGATYDERVAVIDGDTLPMCITFPAWVPDTMGIVPVRCSTELHADIAPENDLCVSSVEVVPADVGVLEILMPDRVTPGCHVTAIGRVFNYAGISVEYPVRLKVGADFDTTVFVAEHDTGCLDATFPPWVAETPGTYPVTCSTELRFDRCPENDRCTDSVIVVPGDVGALDIATPDTAFLHGPIAPICRVRNYARIPAAYRVRVRIGDYYDDSAFVACHDSGDYLVHLPVWTPERLGVVAVQCSTMMILDQNPANDGALDSITVIPGTWIPLSNLPSGRLSKGAKDGAALASAQPAPYGAESKSPTSSLGDSLPPVYALKGNNTREFYAYRIPLNSWTTLESLPATGRSGKVKAVKKGGSLCVAGDQVYATKGNNTLDFWRYDPASQRWTPMPDVPLGSRTCKEGVSMAAVETDGNGYIYLLKGSGTYEFYRYDIAADSWDMSLPSAPGDASGKPYKVGSSIAFDQGDTIWCLKGTYNEFAAYSISGRRWITREPLPRVAPPGTKKTKVKDGSQIACRERVVYALKGNTTTEFWSYRADSGRWSVRQSVPISGGKKVKAGGALIAAANRLYALKGNGTLEFYCFLGDGDTALSAKLGGIAGRKDLPGLRPQLEVSPNPFAASATVRYALPKAGNASLKLFDVSGRLARVLASGFYPAGAYQLGVTRDQTLIAAGIYLLELRAGDIRLTRKLVLQ
jgi:hypothetical protein